MGKLAGFLVPQRGKIYYSAHQSGRAVDCAMGSANDSGNVATQRATTTWAWLNTNAIRFGFYRYDAEPWRWEYNPPA